MSFLGRGCGLPRRFAPRNDKILWLSVPVIARRPNGPTWQSVPKTHEYQHIPDFLVTDSHVAAQPLAALLPYGCGVPLAGASLLGMTETGLLTR